MRTPELLAKHIHEIHFGKNWTCSNLKDQLADVTWQEALTIVDSFNSIATLAFHINYYVDAVIKVFEGNALEAKDELSFDHPPIHTSEDWQAFQNKMWKDAEQFSLLIQKLPEKQLWEEFTDKKYGDYARNILGIVEHSHYHLGQIVLLKKMLRK